MKKYLNYTLTALALMALVACSEEGSSTSSGTPVQDLTAIRRS